MPKKRYKFRAKDEYGEWEEFLADSLDEASELAKEWIEQGFEEYPPDMVGVTVYRLDEDGERDDSETRHFYVETGKEPGPPETECGTEDEDHDWISPHEIVGGLEDNPGSFMINGITAEHKYACSDCGLLKTEIVRLYARKAYERLRTTTYEQE